MLKEFMNAAAKFCANLQKSKTQRCCDVIAEAREHKSSELLLHVVQKMAAHASDAPETVDLFIDAANDPLLISDSMYDEPVLQAFEDAMANDARSAKENKKLMAAYIAHMNTLPSARRRAQAFGDAAITMLSPGREESIFVRGFDENQAAIMNNVLRAATCLEFALSDVDSLVCKAANGFIKSVRLLPEDSREEFLSEARINALKDSFFGRLVEAELRTMEAVERRSEAQAVKLRKNDVKLGF